MAVTITSNFYQDSAWKTVSKIVFTSPNISSPAAAGTRSHILPGQGDLGLWYEDSSYMYKIEDSQVDTVTSFYDYDIETTSELILGSSATVTVTGTGSKYEVFQEYMKDGVGYTAIGYDALTMSGTGANVTETRVKLQYTYSDTSIWTLGHIPNVYSNEVNQFSGSSDVFTIYEKTTSCPVGSTYEKNEAWVVDVIPAEAVCYIDVDLDKPYKVTKIYMRSQYVKNVDSGSYIHQRFFGNYKIYGKLEVTDSWTELYSGANTTNNEADAYLTTNTNFYRYYRLEILNNTGLNITNDDTNYYAVADLKFYDYEYNVISTRTKPVYNFKTNGDADIVYVDSVTDNGDSTYTLGIDSVTGSGTLPTSTTLYGWGAIAGRADYQMDDSIVFEVTAGEAYNCRLTAWDDVTHSSTLNELIAGDHVRVSSLAFMATNSKLDPEESFSPINYVWGPVQNRIFKGNVTYLGTNYYYGDFDMIHRPDSAQYGDYLIFKPQLYNITDAISYGVHDFVITLHYSYT